MRKGESLKLEKILLYAAGPAVALFLIKRAQTRIVGAPPVPHSQVIGATGSNAYFDETAGAAFWGTSPLTS
jgi:hypothetical protein